MHVLCELELCFIKLSTFLSHSDVGFAKVMSCTSHLRPVLLDPSSVSGFTVSLLAHAVGAAIPTIQMLHQLRLAGARMWVV